MITVLRPGMLASVQDLGREGHRQLGVCPGGALDTQGLRMANWLVGNADTAAGLELTLGNAELRFDRDTRIAFMGDDFGARLDGVPVYAGWSMPVRAGQRLTFGGANAAPGKVGVRTWLAVAGGIDVPLLMGSRSTDLKAGFGGFEGRALKKGDVLPVGASALDAAQLARRPFGIQGLDQLHERGAVMPAQDPALTVLRIIAGPEVGQFDDAARRTFREAEWRITPQSNRMGSRLDGPTLQRNATGDMLSAGVIPGTVQVPPAGQPIILMGDAQTTGGYPRIAVVIRADLWKLARAPLGGKVRFVRVDLDAALAAWELQQHHLSAMRQGLLAMGWPLSP